MTQRPDTQRPDTRRAGTPAPASGPSPREAAAAPLLAVRDLRVTIRARTGTVEAVAGVSFDILPGRTLALVGESGSGKSMTAMALIGLVPVGTTVETAGSARFGGRELLTLSEAERRALRGRAIATILQDPAAALDPLMSAGEQIAEALPRGLGRREAAGRVAALLAEVGLDGVPGIARRHPHELSGGQQQRVAIAMALAGNPSLLIADEPTTALDVTVQAQILDLLARLQAARGMAILLITHDLGVVGAYAQDVVVMRAGAMVEAGPAARVLAAPREAHTRTLLAARPALRATAAPSAAAPEILAVSDLAVRYRGAGLLGRPVRALDGIDFALEAGGALGVVGESGSGKSTLAKAIVGLARIERGSVRLGGAVLADPMRLGRAARARLQYIFQDSYGALNPRLTVEDAIGEPFAISGRPRAGRRAAVLALLDEVGLARTHLGRLPRELSGGQRQRVCIARALALSPEVLICDEIVSALDVTVQAQVLGLLRRLRAERGLALVFISHDLAVVAELCTRVMVMKDGKAVESGAAADVFEAPRAAYTRDLIAAARALDAPAPHRDLSTPSPAAGEGGGVEWVTAAGF
ncbi:dipeptide ABC transporter ATP-binding protein [Prosthecomicrobium pneumaticum]|uniref:ABC-type glutathione transport system ATPase component n=1 Tax=Prosthecomicrobium pneumaticum TaxID=81895 RepID=A0A7W9FMD3_9HYPH|nr:ABC transporter ATP-binding protein [Prosthecomicrobium pneumaticum]MBB5753348.1 ABC-type glutathione transport system ATPase component [Prosthecomicrobium pneumaticum]